jgi:hypothetical protein
MTTPQPIPDPVPAPGLTPDTWQPARPLPAGPSVTFGQPVQVDPGQLPVPATIPLPAVAPAPYPATAPRPGHPPVAGYPQPYGPATPPAGYQQPSWPAAPPPGYPAAYGAPQPGTYPQPPYPYPVPPQIVINNVASASAAGYAIGRRPYRKQSVLVHLVLFFLTCGVGNIFYAIHVSNWNKRH